MEICPEKKRNSLPRPENNINRPGEKKNCLPWPKTEDIGPGKKRNYLPWPNKGDIWPGKRYGAKQEEARRGLGSKSGTMLVN